MGGDGRRVGSGCPMPSLSPPAVRMEMPMVVRPERHPSGRMLGPSSGPDRLSSSSARKQSGGVHSLIGAGARSGCVLVCVCVNVR